MDPALQRRIQRYGWDKAADNYEAGWEEQLRPAQDLLLDLIDLRQGERVLDVACGTGLVSFRAAAAVGSSGQLLGTDISDTMITGCRERMAELGLSNAVFERMDAEELALEDSSFDAAVCALGLMYVPDPVRALREMCRVLRPGGRVAVAVWGQRRQCGWAEIFDIVDRRVATEVCPLFFQLGNPESLDMAMKSAGFGNIESRRIRVALSYRDGDQACDAAFAGGPVALAYGRFSSVVKEEARREYLQSIEAYQANEGYRIPGEFVVVSARKLMPDS